MANSPRKSKDPTELALSAIEEALNMHDISRDPPNRPAADALPHAREPQLDFDAPRPASDLREDLAAPIRPAANDDRESVGHLLRALQRRPSRAPFVVAWLFTACWTVLIGSLAFGTYWAELSQLISQGVSSAPVLLGLAGAFLGPIALFFFLAAMLSRAQELRLVGQSMAQIAIRLAEPESVARDSVISVGQAVRREVAAIGDGIERALARAAELEGMVNNEVSALERVYADNEARMRGLIDGIVTQRETLVDHAEQVRAAMSNVHVDLSQEIGALSSMVTEQVHEAAQRITEALAEKGQAISGALQASGEAMVASVGERGGNLLERLEQASEITTRAIDAASERMTTNLTFKTANINREFEEIADNLRHMMASKLDNVADEFSQKAVAVVDNMQSRAENISQTLMSASTNMAEAIAARVDDVNNTLKATGDSLVLDLNLRGGDVVAKLEQTAASITSAIVTSGDRVSETFQQHAENLTTSVATQGDAMRELLTQRLASFEQMFSHGGTELAERISRDSAALGDLIARHLGEFDHTLKTYGGELVERIGSRTHEIGDTLKDYVENFDERVTSRVGDVSAVIDERLNRFQEALETRTQGLNDALSSRVMEIAKNVAESGNVVVRALDERAEAVGDKIAEMAQVVSERGDAVVSALDSRVEVAANRISGHADQLLTRLAAKVDEAERKFGAQAGGIAGTLDQRIVRFEELLTGRAESVVREIESRGISTAELLRSTIDSLENTTAGSMRNIAARADEAINDVSRRSSELVRLLDERGGPLITAINSKTTELTGELARITDHAVNAIETKGLTYARTLRDNSNDIAQRINDASEHAAAQIGKALRDLETSAASTVETSKRTATAAVAEILETNGMLRSDTTALFERLREANGLLQEVLSGAHSNLTSIESVLSTRVTEFVGAMNTLLERTGSTAGNLDQHIGGFYEVTGKVLENLSDLSARFDRHGRDLAAAAEQVESANKHTELVVGDRRVALEALINTLDSRSGEIEERLKLFNGLLDESLESAEARARDIAQTIAEATANGTRAITDQYQQVRESAEDERRRTLDALRQIYDHATGDAQSMFQGATERFTEIVQSMKHMANEMQKELETTRQELRRGILELPQETAESAAQMRRVIVDQIEALAELNRIVARHGREVEMSEPIARRPAAREETAAVAGTRAEAARPAPFVGNAPPMAPSARRAERGTERGGNYAPPPSPAPQPASSAQQAQANWLSDLLSRASRDNEPQPARGRGGDERSTRHTIESLDSLSVDIARMIDHDAAAELWERYNRGERNVFTRKLYTMQGQKAFEEVRRRYRSDREFKQTVDRYIAEFERLLDEVSRDDRGQVVVRTYLTSETGKVYTMLAHAAGRIE